MDGMVPSGSLWTGWLDTALNVLYIRIACFHESLLDEEVQVMCAGDDNLTLLARDLGDVRIWRIRDRLNI